MFSGGLFLLVGLVAFADEPVDVPIDVPVEESTLNPDLADVEIGSDQLAAIYLEAEVERYEGRYRFKRIGENVPSHLRFAVGRVHLDRQGGVTYLEVEGEVIHDDPGEPLPGLPQNTVGQVVDFRLDLQGFGEKGRVRIYGSVQYDHLRPEQPIEVTLRPEWRQQFVAYNPPSGVDPDHLVIEVGGEIRGSYSSGKGGGGFDLWLDPLAGQVEYLIRDLSTGRVLSSGSAEPLKQPEQDKVHPVNFTYAGGVVEIDLRSKNRVERPDQALDAQVEADEGQMIPAAVYMVRRDGSAGSGHLSFVDFPGGTVEVLTPGPDGEMELLDLRHSHSGGWQGITLPAGPDSLGVVFYGGPPGFRVNFLSATAAKG